MRIIQLWANSDETEFAIRLASDTIAFRAYSSNTADYVKVVDEMREIDEQQIDWPYMLEKWIVAWKDGFRHSTQSYGWKLQGAQRGAELRDPVPPSASGAKRQKGRKSKARRKYRRRKLSVKCRFCNLMFYNDVECSTHEKEWHADKLKIK